MERLKERLSSARRALETLKELSGIEKVTVIQRDAAIQRFEYTFEAVWKAGRLYLKAIEGLDIGSPKGVIRACMKTGVFNEEQTAMALDMVDDGNQTSHTYNEDLAEKIYGRLENYVSVCEHWLKKVEEKIKKVTMDTK